MTESDWYVHIVMYEKMEGSNKAKPIEECRVTTSGPFSSRQAAESFAVATANRTPVFKATIAQQEGM